MSKTGATKKNAKKVVEKKGTKEENDAPVYKSLAGLVADLVKTRGRVVGGMYDLLVTRFPTVEAFDTSIKSIRRRILHEWQIEENQSVEIRRGFENLKDIVGKKKSRTRNNLMKDDGAYEYYRKVQKNIQQTLDRVRKLYLNDLEISSLSKLSASDKRVMDASASDKRYMKVVAKLLTLHKEVKEEELYRLWDETAKSEAEVEAEDDDSGEPAEADDDDDDFEELADSDDDFSGEPLLILIVNRFTKLTLFYVYKMYRR